MGAAKASVRDPAARRRFWERFFRGPVAAAVLAGDERWARERMLAEVNRTAPSEPGHVAIVGAGPGDPDLLTLAAHRRLQDADVVAFDRTVPPAIVAYARRDAHRLQIAADPAQVAEGVAALARDGGRIVVLLGGGDAADGRASDIAAQLHSRGVRMDIVAGVAAAPANAAQRVAV